MFPGKFALVVCDGHSGYGEQDIFFDGLGTGYHKLDWEHWPWTETPNPNAQDAPDERSSKAQMEQMVQSLSRMGIVFHRATSLSCTDVSSLGEGSDVSSLDDEGAYGSDTFVAGDRVQVHGLTTDAGLILNGKTGTVLDFEGDHRYSVTFDDSEVPKIIRSNNLMKIGVLQSVGEMSTCSLQVGDCVVIAGLQNEGAQALNG